MEGYRSGHNGAVLKTVRAVMSTRVRILHPPPNSFKSEPKYVFINGVFGCVFYRQSEQK